MQPDVQLITWYTELHKLSGHQSSIKMHEQADKLAPELVSQSTYNTLTTI